MQLVQRAHPAMATRFEVLLAGEDCEHLEAVSTLIFEEIDRVERLLSRFDPASEVARINQSPCGKPLKLSVELAEILEQCREWHALTEKTFDVVATKHDPRRIGWSEIELDVSHRTLLIHRPDAILDFGGFGKGYALDRGSAILRRYGVEHAFLHAGTSSALGIGLNPSNGQPWRAGVGLGTSRHYVELQDAALSTSATVDENHSLCEVVDPRNGQFVTGRKSCFAVAETAAIAEILSTAFLIVGVQASLWGEDWYEQGDWRLRRGGWYEGELGHERYTEGAVRIR